VVGCYYATAAAAAAAAAVVDGASLALRLGHYPRPNVSCEG